ncbi:MAG: efflux RND transporter periplasmic adaptor subunit, partial [Lachnospiraceae bacterium]|nr:efflux RND transporter periplasmic adaptor subunit [Lachnospiraceae bacterium]
AAVDAAQLQLDYANVTSPVSGIITAKGVTKNNMTSPGSVAYTIMSNGSKYVVFYVSEVVMKELSEGQSITVDKNGIKYDAQIIENPGVADQQSGLFKVKAKINSSEDIVNGVKVKLIMTTQHADNVLTLPIDAVYHENEKSYVYTYSDGKANKVYVETGLFNDSVIEIIDGIALDDQVITTWSSQLRNGVEVKVDNSVSSNDIQSDDILVERN